MGVPFMPPIFISIERCEDLPLFQKALRFVQDPLFFDEGAAVVHAAVVVHARHGERPTGPGGTHYK